MTPLHWMAGCNLNVDTAKRLIGDGVNICAEDDNGVTPFGIFLRSAVKRWKVQIRQGGLHALARKPDSGRPASLTPEQFGRLVESSTLFLNDFTPVPFQVDSTTSSPARLVLSKTRHAIAQAVSKSNRHWRRYVWSRVKKSAGRKVSLRLSRAKAGLICFPISSKRGRPRHNADPLRVKRSGRANFVSTLKNSRRTAE